MIRQPFFSIIIPTYNRAHIIRRTIEHVLANEFIDFELIIVDDGSMDNTKDVVESFSDNRIRYFWKENGERGAARNFGLGKAKGKYINYFDSDELQHPNHLKEAYLYLQKYSDRKIINFAYEIVNGDKTKKIVSSDEFLNNTIVEYNSISPGSVFIESSVAKKYRFSEDRRFIFGEDLYLWLKIIPFSKIYNSPIITHTILDGEGRSVAVLEPEKVLYFIKQFYDLINYNKEYKNYYKGAKGRKVLANHYNILAVTYLNHHINNLSKAAHYFCKSILMNPKLILKKRTLYFIKTMLLP